MKVLLSAILCLLASTALADSYYCPGHNAFIKPGDNVAQVISACGQPTTREESKRAATIAQPIQQYFYQLNGLSLAMTVAQNRVVRISVGGEPVGSTSLCADFDEVRVGDSADKMAITCGAPSAVNSTNAEVPTGQSQIIETWTYKFNNYQPAIVLTFVGGVLTNIQK